MSSCKEKIMSVNKRLLFQIEKITSFEVNLASPLRLINNGISK